VEELEQALKKYNMGDEKTIHEIIVEVDTDHVLFLSLFSLSFEIISYSSFVLSLFLIWGIDLWNTITLPKRRKIWMYKDRVMYNQILWILGAFRILINVAKEGPLSFFLDECTKTET